MIQAAVCRGVDPAPSNIGMTDVKQVEAATRAMRAVDYQFGGGACRDAVVAQLSWAQRLLGASGTEEVRQRLFRAMSDLQNLAGWTNFDVGLLDSSHNYFATALEFAKQSGDSGLMSNCHRVHDADHVQLGHHIPHRGHIPEHQMPGPLGLHRGLAA
jgi:hypothetical protein